MSRSDETLYRQWVMLTRIPRYPKKISAPEIKEILNSEGYNVDTRTVQRDLNKLSISFPLSNDTEGRKNYWFWIEEASIQDLPGMDPVTALAFNMSESYLTPLLPAATLTLLRPYFNRAHEVLNDHSESQLRHWPDKVSVIGRGFTLQQPSINPEVQRTIYEGLLQEKILIARYQPRGSQVIKDYEIHPLGIVSRMGLFYLVCTLWDYDDIKQFALHRFTQVEMTNQDITFHRGFSLEDYIQKEQQFSYPLSREPIFLRALFDAQTARHLAETTLSVKQTLTAQEDGRVLLEAEVTDTLELRWWLQGFGDNVEVLEPIAMRDKFRAVAESLRRIYQQ